MTLNDLKGLGVYNKLFKGIAGGGAIEQSEHVRSTLFIHVLPCEFLDCYIKAAENFVMYETIFDRDWGLMDPDTSGASRPL